MSGKIQPIDVTKRLLIADRDPKSGDIIHVDLWDMRVSDVNERGWVLMYYVDTPQKGLAPTLGWLRESGAFYVSRADGGPVTKGEASQ